MWQRQQPLHRMNQGAVGLRPQVGNGVGNEAHIRAWVLPKDGFDGRRHAFNVGHHDDHITRRQGLPTGRLRKPVEQLVMQHFEFAHGAVGHAKEDRAIALGPRGGWVLSRGRHQIANAPLQLRQCRRALRDGCIVKKVQRGQLHALAGGLGIVKGIEHAHKVAPLPAPAGQQRRSVGMHLRKVHIGQRLALVTLPALLAAQPLAPIHDVGPVVAAGVGHGQQDLAVIRQRRQQLQQLHGHVAHAKHRYARCYRLCRTLPRSQPRQYTLVHGGTGVVTLGFGQRGQHTSPQLGLPQMVLRQRHSAVHLAAIIGTRGPIVQPVWSVDLILVIQVSQTTGQLQQTVRLIALQKTAHRLEDFFVHTLRQQSHQAPGHGQFVQRRIRGHNACTQHLPIGAPQKPRRQLHLRRGAHPVRTSQRHLDPLGHAVALHQHHLGLQWRQRLALQPRSQRVHQGLGLVAVQSGPAGGNGVIRHENNFYNCV